MAELGRTYTKAALQRALAGAEGARLIGATIADTMVSNVQDALAHLKTVVDTKLDANHSSVTNTRTPTDATVTNAKVANNAAIAEDKLALNSDAPAATPSRRTLGTGATQAAAGNDNRLSDTRTPTDASVTNAKVAASAAIAETKLALASDAAAATPSRRTLGPGANQAAPGNDNRLSDTRTPTDASVTNTKVAAGAAIAEEKLALASDAAAATASRRTLGPGAQQAAPGNDNRLSDTRTPTDASVTLAKHAASMGPWIRVQDQAGRLALGPIKQGQIVFEASTSIYWKNTSQDGTLASAATWLDMAPVGGSIPAASEAEPGVLRLATQPQANAGADDSTALTPLKLASLTQIKERFALTNPALSLEGEVAYDASRHALEVHDGVRIKEMPNGYAPFAFTLGAFANGSYTVVQQIAAAGGVLLIPVQVTTHMIAVSITYHDLATATARGPMEAVIYEDQRNNDALITRLGSGTLAAYTPTAVSNRTIPLSAPVYLSPGVYFVALKCNAASTGTNIGVAASGSIAQNIYQQKTLTTAPLGATLDAATGWSKLQTMPGLRINGSTFGQAVAF